MSEFDLITAFIEADLADKVLREWEDDGHHIRRVFLWAGSLAIGLRVRDLPGDEGLVPTCSDSRTVENELRRQMQEYLDERDVVVWRINSVWYANRGKLTLDEDGRFSPSQTRQRRFRTRPEAEFGACVAITEDET